MQLEEAVKYLKHIKEKDEKYLEEYDIKDKDMFRNDIEAISTVLQALDNFIPKEKVEKIEKYCKTKSKFQTFGDEQLKRAIEVYVNKTKNDVLSLLEE